MPSIMLPMSFIFLKYEYTPERITTIENGTEILNNDFKLKLVSRNNMTMKTDAIFVICCKPVGIMYILNKA